MTEKNVEAIRHSQSDIAAARVLAEKIDALFIHIGQQEQGLRKDFVRVGGLVGEMRSKHYWMALGYPSFNSYISYLTYQYGRKRSQLYNYVGVVEKLLPHVGEKNLQEMGISKACELKKYTTFTGKAPNEDIVKQAVDPDVDIPHLRAILASEHHFNITSPDKGRWLDMAGFYVNAEEKKWFRRGWEIVKRIDPVIPQDAPDWYQLKMVQERLLQEFLATHQNEAKLASSSPQNGQIEDGVQECAA